MQVLNSYAKDFNQLNGMLPPQVQAHVNKFSKDNKLEPGFIPMVVIALVSLIIMYLKGMQMIMATLTCVYPMFKSIMAIEDNENDEEKKAWLSFWCIYSLMQVYDITAGFILSMIIPFYWFFRMMFFVYLMAP